MTGSRSGDAGSGRTAFRLAWTLWSVSIAFAITQIVLVIMARHVRAAPGFGFPAFESVIAIVFSSVGALVASKQPANPIGWIFLAVGLEGGIQGTGLAYALNGILGPRAPWPGASFGAWINSWLWFPTIMVVLTLVFQLFPTGGFISGAWRRLGWVTVGITSVGSAGLALAPGPLENFATLENPYGINSRIVVIAGTAGFLLSNLAIIASVVSVIVRYARSGQNEREQIKWLAYAGTVAALVVPAGNYFSRFKAVDALVIASILFVPISIGIAVLRYRLFDIDRIISRSLSYAIVTAILTVTYFVIALAPVAVLGYRSSPPNGLIAAGTLIAAAAFRPLRHRVQNVVDRRFNRARYDAANTIEAFSARLRDEIDLDSLGAELRTVIEETMQPSHMWFWVSER